MNKYKDIIDCELMNKILCRLSLESYEEYLSFYKVFIGEYDQSLNFEKAFNIALLDLLTINKKSKTHELKVIEILDKYDDLIEFNKHKKISTMKGIDAINRLIDEAKVKIQYYSCV